MAFEIELSVEEDAEPADYTCWLDLDGWTVGGLEAYGWERGGVGSRAGEVDKLRLIKVDGET
jgi:hypothetical protein